MAGSHPYASYISPPISLLPTKPSHFLTLGFYISLSTFREHLHNPSDGLSDDTDERGLRESFNKYGEVVDARLVVDSETGKSRRFGFVMFASSEEASAAIQGLDQQELDGSRVRVFYANFDGDGAAGNGSGTADGGLENKFNGGADEGIYGGDGASENYADKQG